MHTCTAISRLAIRVGSRNIHQYILQDYNLHVHHLVIRMLLLWHSCWHTVSSEANVNPFPGAYLNACSLLRLTPVTTGCQTLLEMKVTFLTEPPQAVSHLSCLSAYLVILCTCSLESGCCTMPACMAQPACRVPQVQAILTPSMCISISILAVAELFHHAPTRKLHPMSVAVLNQAGDRIFC